MLGRRQLLALLIGSVLVAAPVWGAPTAGLGTLVYAQGASVGSSSASVGATVFGGDRLSTGPAGSLQVRTGAARFLLSGTSSAILLEDPGSPAAILTAGSATFSTAHANAFALHAFAAVVKANSNDPTIGQVTVLARNELLVKSIRGSLECTVDDETRVIPEGEAYRVVLADSAAADQGPAGSGSGRPPRKAGKNRAIYYIAGAAAILTVFALHEALESPDRP